MPGVAQWLKTVLVLLLIGLTAFAGLSTPLRWGEVVPLWFVARGLWNKNPIAQHQTDPQDDHFNVRDARFVIFSQPRGLGCTRKSGSFLSSWGWLDS